MSTAGSTGSTDNPNNPGSTGNAGTERWAAGRPSPRRLAAITFGVLGTMVIVTLTLTTPWDPLPGPVPGGEVAADPARDFTAAEIARSRSFDAALNPPAYLGLIVGIAAVGVLGLTPLGGRLLGSVIRPVRRRSLQVILAAVTLSALTTVVGLPFGVWRETVSRRYGLSTQDWGSWTVDLAKSFGVGVVIWGVALLGLHLLIRRFPRNWWAGAAVGGFLLVVTVSYVYPVVVEPVFNSFRPMPAGQLRTDLLQMARRDGVPVRDVLVADASRRTTALNAYVSGFGATRRIVVYDTLLTSPAKEIELIVAHELGHAKSRDVLYGTLVGALGTAAAVCLLYLLMTSRRLLRRAGVESAADPRSIALLLAVVTVMSQLSGPIQNLVSRRIEARADVHSLDLTGDPATFIAMQRSLSVTNISDLRPHSVERLLWASHPSGPERIAMARDWARVRRGPATAVIVSEPPPGARTW